MNNPLDVPAELLHLVEKRDSESDRRQAERRLVESALDEDTVKIEPDVSADSANSACDAAKQQDENSKERRDSDRRNENRRDQDD